MPLETSCIGMHYKTWFCEVLAGLMLLLLQQWHGVAVECVLFEMVALG